MLPVSCISYKICILCHLWTSVEGANQIYDDDDDDDELNLVFCFLPLFQYIRKHRKPVISYEEALCQVKEEMGLA